MSSRSSGRACRLRRGGRLRHRHLGEPAGTVVEVERRQGVGALDQADAAQVVAEDDFVVLPIALDDLGLPLPNLCTIWSNARACG